MGKRVTARDGVPSADFRQTMAQMVQGAFEGRVEWLDDLLHGAGYVRATEGVAQADLVAGVPRLTRQTLLNWQQDGLAVVKRGARAYYHPVALVAWLYERFVRAGRPSLREEEYRDWETVDLRYKAQTRQLTYEKLSERMIDKAEAERLMIGMVLQVKAALLTLCINVAPKLEHRDAPTIHRILDAQMRWLCTEMSRGRVPVPPEALADVEAAIARHCGPLPVADDDAGPCTPPPACPPDAAPQAPPPAPQAPTRPAEHGRDAE